jgi:putative transposase
MQLQGKLSIEQMCCLGQVSRAGYYRRMAASAPDEEQTTVRAAIHEIVLQHRRRYGYRRVTAELKSRGLAVNHKRVARLMREDNLLAVGKRKFVRTTNAEPAFEVYINAAARLAVTGPDQLWVADITYIRLREQFVFFAGVLDAFSRRVVSWALEESMQASLTLSALQQALAARNPRPGLVHHSDRGSQYAAREYVDLLIQHGIVPSMSRPANPWDNAICESFLKTLKQEEIYARDYRNLQELRSNIAEFIENYYNPRRLHSALGYRSPEAYERDFRANAEMMLVNAPKMSFLRHVEIYNPM